LKKILISGINGFIGSNCAVFFREKNYEVFGIDIFGGEALNFLQGEVNLKNLKSFNQNFDVILHLAGSGTVGSAQTSPELEHTKTVGSTEHILEYIKDFNKDAKLIYSSSAAIYGDSHKDKIKESDSLNPISAYGAHKVEVEELCRKYHEKFELNINIIRFFSIYGEGLKKQLLWDFSNRVVKNMASETLPCFGTGAEERDFIHIKDAIRLIELLINSDNNFTIINGATGHSTTVLEVLNLLCEELNFKGKLIFDNIVKEGNPKILVADIEKAKNMGFSPQISLKDGIKRYVRWFKENN